MKRSLEDVLIVGAGQGGLSASYFLIRQGIPHRILERGDVAHAWAAQRWDSFCLVTPNWTVNLPGKPYDGDDPDGFMPRDDFVAYMKAWARSFDAPVVPGTDVIRISREAGGFALATSRGAMQARTVIVATATYQRPKLPAVAKKLPGDIRQFHAEDYKNPNQVPEGAVLVVGSGQTGCQIVEDFLRARRDVYLCVARTGRLPRRYRGRDCLVWQRDMLLLDRTPDMLDDPADRFVGDPHLTGRDGGATVSLHDFHRRGVSLLGRLEDVDDRVLRLRNDLADSMAFADRFCFDLMRRIDDFVEASGADAPQPTEAELAGGPEPGDPAPVSPARLDLDAANIRTVIWATGFAYDFSWIDGVPADALDYPLTRDGASPMPGLFFCGLNWMRKRKSGILYGVEEDARIVAQQVQAYLRSPGQAA